MSDEYVTRKELEDYIDVQIRNTHSSLQQLENFVSEQIRKLQEKKENHSIAQVGSEELIALRFNDPEDMILYRSNLSAANTPIAAVDERTVVITRSCYSAIRSSIREEYTTVPVVD